MNYQAPKIEWKTEQETETDGFCSYEANTATHKYRIYYSGAMKSWICTCYRFSKPETKRHKYLPTAQELKEWVETTHYPSALRKAGFKPVDKEVLKPDAVERPLTLVEKLELEVKRLLELKAQEKPHSLGYVFLGHHIAATVNAINIVKQHEAESEVQDD